MMLRHFGDIVATLTYLFVAVSNPAQGQATYALKDIEGSRLQEFVISVSDIDAVLPAFTDVLEWEIKHQGAINPTVIRLWGLDFSTIGREVLVGNRDSQFGFVRLVEINSTDKKPMRPGARWWDTGGLFNFNVLAKDLDKIETGLRHLGWTSRSIKSTYKRGETARGESQIMIGPDGLVISFQERQAPPLKGWPPFTGAGHIETGYQMVRDIEEWYKFYTDVLGFKGIGLRDHPQKGPIGANDYGLPHNQTAGAGYTQANVIFPPSSKQSLGARQWLTAEGYDFSDRIAAPNLGILSVRLPVPDLDQVLRRLKAAGHELAQEVQILFLEPYGAVRAAMVRSPGGSGQLLTLFEPNAKPMTKAELEAFFAPGRFGEWVRFNGRMTGTIHYMVGGDARVTWENGLDEEGVWVVKGDAICTAWYRLRDFRELCVEHYKIGETITQSFRIGAGPDGITTFGPPDNP